MENQTLHMPANYALVDSNEMVYLDGGELSELQVKLLLGTASVLIASINLIPNVFAYILSPILTPIGDAFTDLTKPIVDSIKNIFK